MFTLDRDNRILHVGLGQHFFVIHYRPQTPYIVAGVVLFVLLVVLVLTQGFMWFRPEN